MGLMIQFVTVACMFQFGVIISSIGALKLSVARELKLDNRQVAGMISAMMLTSAIVVLLVGPLVDAFGHRPLAVAGLAIGALGLLLLVSARSYSVAIVSCVILGAGGICACTVSSTLMPLVLFGGKNAPAASNLGNAFFGLGAFFTAFIVGLAQKGRSYRVAGAILAAVMLASVLPAFLADYPQVASDFSLGQAIALLGNAVVLVAALAFFMNTGVENTMGNWITTYGASLGLSDRNANMLLSAFWVSTTISRLATAPIITAATGTTAIVSMAAVMLVMLAVLRCTHSKWLAGIGVLAIGLMVGPITPTITGVMFSKLPSSLYGSAFAIFFAVGLIGATSIPGGVGLASRKRTIQQAFAIPMAATILVIVFTLVLHTL